MAKTLGQVLQEARHEKGWSLRQVGAEVDISLPYLHDIEHNRRIPADAVLRKLGQALGLDLDVIFSLAGKLGEQADTYLRRHPGAQTLMRVLAERRVSEAGLARAIEYARTLT